MLNGERPWGDTKKTATDKPKTEDSRKQPCLHFDLRFLA